MEGVRRRRGDLVVASRRRKPSVGQGRVVVAVDQVMRDAGVIRLRSEDRLEDPRGVPLVRVRLVGGRRGRVERERVEDGRLGVIGITLVNAAHGRLVAEGPTPMIHSTGVLVECGDGVDPGRFAVGLGDGLRALHSRGTGLKSGGGRREPEGIPVTHGESPKPHGAARVGLRDGRELPGGMRVPERVEDRHRVVE